MSAARLVADGSFKKARASSTVAMRLHKSSESRRRNSASPAGGAGGTSSAASTRRSIRWCNGSAAPARWAIAPSTNAARQQTTGVRRGRREVNRIMPELHRGGQEGGGYGQRERPSRN